MSSLRFIVLVIVIASYGCQRAGHEIVSEKEGITTLTDSIPESYRPNKAGNGALMVTRFKSYDEFKAVVHISYSASNGKSKEVRLEYRNGNQEVTSILKSGISESEFVRARNGNLWDKIKLCLACPFAVMNKHELKGIENLGRRRPWKFGKGDVAFYDLAETMVHQISAEDLPTIPPEDLTEKGFLNTFNHITAQAFMTSVTSEAIADFVADVHERFNLPDMISGKFTVEELNNLKDGPLDNYIDMLNNEWGQELGKSLRTKYHISPKTHWTPALLTNYLNDIESYYSWAFQIGFRPFKPSDEIIVRFANKINLVLVGGE